MIAHHESSIIFADVDAYVILSVTVYPICLSFQTPDFTGLLVPTARQLPDLTILRNKRLLPDFLQSSVGWVAEPRRDVGIVSANAGGVARASPVAPGNDREKDV